MDCSRQTSPFFSAGRKAFLACTQAACAASLLACYVKLPHWRESGGIVASACFEWAFDANLGDVVDVRLLSSALGHGRDSKQELAHH